MEDSQKKKKNGIGGSFFGCLEPLLEVASRK